MSLPTVRRSTVGFIAAPASWSAGEKHWIANYANAHGGCGWYITAFNFKAGFGELPSYLLTRYELFDRSLTEWSDDDFAKAVQIYKDCSARLQPGYPTT